MPRTEVVRFYMEFYLAISLSVRVFILTPTSVLDLRANSTGMTLSIL